MKPKDIFQNDSGHSIEWGEATWDKDDFSIRNRYDNPLTGRFNKAGSSEVPWEDFKMMIKQSILRGHLENKDLAEILGYIETVQ